MNLLHRPPRDPAPGGVIERYFETVQSQYEAEVRAGDILTLEKLNRGLSAWLEMAYHQTFHSETGQTPIERYGQGKTVIRAVDMAAVLESFMKREPRTVHRDFADVRLHNRLYRVDPKLRGDKVEVRYDPYGALDTVQLFSLDGRYLGEGVLHHRQTGAAAAPYQPSKPQHSYTDLRLLLSSPIDDAPKLKMVLCGQETLRSLLTREAHADLANRISVRAHLNPLTKDQTTAYIDHRVKHSGAPPKLFEKEAKTLIHDYAAGIPRQINNIATACLIHAAAQNQNKVTEDTVNHAMAEFRLP